MMRVVRFTKLLGARVSQYSTLGLRALQFVALYDPCSPGTERTYLLYV